MMKLAPGILLSLLILTGCISTDNPVLDAGDGTPDITRCTVLNGVLPGDEHAPQGAQTVAGREHPDVFYLGWSQLDERNDLRAPARGYAGSGFEDKLFVSRKLPDQDGYRTWQLLPKLSETCKDEEKIRIHSFDIAPDGTSLYVSMRRAGDAHLGIYRFDFTNYTFHKLTSDDGVDFLYPTYVGNDRTTGHPMLFVSKSVDASELPLNYGGPSSGTLVDEYDRAPTPLIHTLDTVTGAVQRIGFNNSHQLDPMAIRHDGRNLVVFTQWEHQQTTNRFSLWKIQIDGSDNFTFFGQESATDRSSANVFQPREVKSGPYAGSILMTQGRKSFIADGSVVMTKREDLDLRSDRHYLDRYDSGYGISRNPEHYNAQSMVYAYRPTVNDAYAIYLKDYPSALSGDTTAGARRLAVSVPDLHLVQPRSFYPPETFVAAPSNGDIGDSRSAYGNDYMYGKSGFLVQDLTQSDNGVQHQLDNISPGEIRLQFFIPSHTFSGPQGSQAIGRLGWGGSPELSVPASRFLAPEVDGSLAALVKPGLYTWKVHKRFDHRPGGTPSGNDLWIPIRAERQELSFVPNRINACNQCHQERSQFNLDLYRDLETQASKKILSSDLSGLPDITGYNAYNSVPDFHAQIMPLLEGCASAGCHDARDKLDLSNKTGWRSENATWLTLVRGGHKLAGSEEVVPYIYNSLNPTGFDDNYHPAPFLWSLLLGDDLSVPPDASHPDNSSRALTRAGDYGATFDQRIADAISAINARYDHTGAWTVGQLQSFITYSSTQSMVGLSDRISFTADSLDTSTAAAQKAYQAMVTECWECHNNHTSGGIDAENFGKPLQKRFRSDSDLRQSHLRFVVDSHKANKDDTAFSQYIWQSDINTSMRNTLRSALDRINFNNSNESQLLVYAAGCNGLHDNVSQTHPCASSDTVNAIRTWVEGGVATNDPPTLNGGLPPITIQEYADPGEVGPVSWSDPEGDLAQLFINRTASSEHTFNDTMLALNYQDFQSAMVSTYAILGDRGNREFEFVVSDGQTNSAVQRVPVQVTTDYIVPKPTSKLPEFSAYYTDRRSGELRHIDHTGNDTRVGDISGYSPQWTTMYRRSDKGWLYFVNQSEQRVYVVDEADAHVLFTIRLDHAPNKETDEHKQTVYLVWWRPGEPGRPGELQGLLESKQGGDSNGDFYVGLGDGGDELAIGSDLVVVPEYRTRLVEADNAVSVYVWRRATFMTQIVGRGIDRLNVLNLVTGKGRNLGNFSFEARNYMGTDYEAKDYYNVRAVLLSEDGAFYGFNQDLDSSPTLFNFDPLEGVQVEVPLPQWLQSLLNNPLRYGTPFVVVPNRPPVI